MILPLISSYGSLAMKFCHTLFLCLLTSSVWAETREKQLYIAPFGSYIQPGGDSHGLGGWGAGAGLGMEAFPNFNIEARGFWQNYQNTFHCCDAETTLAGGTLDAQWFPLEHDVASPYLVAALGGMNTQMINRTLASTQNASSFIFETGLGSYYQLSSLIDLRADVRYRINTLPSNVGSQGVLNDMVVNFGFVTKLP
ncbi:MAG: hypothetical protein RIQ52_1048 [Pseudomonadota bacterium]|jgi:OOP family OmpA-OmpF porin